jgi:hypothetical protein
LSELGLIPALLHNIKPLVMQKYTGDINIIPHVSISDYKNLISNPDSKFIAHCIKNGKASTWPSKKIIFYFFI